MSRFVVGIITAVLVVSVLAPSAIGGVAAQQDETVTVTVSVVDSNGNPVGNIDVSVTWDGGDGGPKNVTTAGNGKAFVDVPNQSDIRIEIDDDEYVRNNPRIVFNVGEQEVEVPVARSGQGSITVSDGQGPVANASVVVSRSGSSVDELTTDQNGQATTRRLERDEYELSVVKPGYFENDTATLSLNSESVSQAVTLERGAQPVTFRVVDRNFDTPQPVEDATIRIRGNSLQTLSNGEATTSLPVNTEYNAQVSKDGYNSVGKSFTLGEEASTVNVSIRRSPEIRLEAANSRVVVGESTFVTATNEYGNPVSGASVTIDGEAAGQTNANGQATVPINSEGNVTISVNDDRGFSDSVTVEGVEDSDDLTPSETTVRTTEEPTEETTAASTATETTGGDGDSGENGPGFGVVTVLVALVAVLVLARLR